MIASIQSILAAQISVTTKWTIALEMTENLLLFSFLLSAQMNGTMPINIIPNRNKLSAGFWLSSDTTDEIMELSPDNA